MDNELKKENWQECLDFIESILSNEGSKRTFDVWFKPLKAISFGIDPKTNKLTLTLFAPSLFVVEYIENEYPELLGRALKKVFGNINLAYSLIDPNKETQTVIPAQNKVVQLSNTIKKPIEENVGKENKETTAIKSPFEAPGIQQFDSQLNPNYNFDNFIEGECNRLARSAGMSIAENPGKTAFNPLFIYGDSGLGKTHLAQAIGIAIKERNPKANVLYVDAYTFENQFTQASMRNDRNSFLYFYQMIDVLIIDDIHCFAEKKGTQNAFFQIFNHLHQKNKQLILTSDKPPVELDGFEDRMLTRFKWGLNAELTCPDVETKIKILKNSIYNDGIKIDDDVIEYIASQTSNSIRELQGAIVSLLAQATNNKKELSLNLAKNVVSKLVKNTKKDISIEMIQETVCDYFNIPIEQMKSNTRKREIVQSRQIAMYFAKNLTKSSLATIGAKIGKKDHATVLHACKTVGNLVETDKRFKVYIDEIEKKFKLQ